MDRVGLATILAEPKRVTDGAGLSPLWIGRLRTEAGDEIRAYIKRAPQEEMLSEIVCAIVGRDMGLPIPRPYLTQDAAGLFGQKSLLYFALEDAEQPSFKQLVADPATKPGLTQALAKWKQLPDAAVFDEWIANDDRNQGNFLFDGTSEWTLIDHARAFGAFPPGTPVPPSKALIKNQFAAATIGLFNELGLAKLRAATAATRPRMDRILPADVVNGANAELYGMTDRLNDVLSFLHDRIDEIPALLSRFGREPELGL